MNGKAMIYYDLDNDSTHNANENGGSKINVSLFAEECCVKQ